MAVVSLSYSAIGRPSAESLLCVDLVIPRKSRPVMPRRVWMLMATSVLCLRRCMPLVSDEETFRIPSLPGSLAWPPLARWCCCPAGALQGMRVVEDRLILLPLSRLQPTAALLVNSAGKALMETHSKEGSLGSATTCAHSGHAEVWRFFPN